MRRRVSRRQDVCAATGFLSNQSERSLRQPDDGNPILRDAYVQLNAKRVSVAVTVPVEFDPKPVNPAVSSKSFGISTRLNKKFQRLVKASARILSSAFSSGHEAVSKMAQRLSEAHAVGKRQAEDSQFVRALLSGGEEHQKEMAERAAKQAEVRGKLLSGTGEFLGKSADFTKRILTGVAGSEEGRAGVKRAFEKIDPIVETAKSGFEAGKSGWELIHNVKELAGWTGTGTATAGAVRRPGRRSGGRRWNACNRSIRCCRGYRCREPRVGG